MARNQTTKFLSIGVNYHFLTEGQAYRIFEEQRRLRRLIPEDEPTCAEIAFELNLLDRVAIGRIEELQRQHQADNRPVADVIMPMSASTLDGPIGGDFNTTKVLFASQLFTMAIALIATGGDVGKAADWVTIITVVVTAALITIYWLLRTEVNWSHLPFKLAPFVAVSAAFVAASEWPQFSRATPRIVFSIAITVALYASALLRSAWRHYMLVYFEARAVLLRRLVSQAETQLTQIRGLPDKSPDIRTLTKPFLTTIARVLYLSPFEGLQRLLFRFTKSPFARTTVWFLTPRDGFLEILDFAVPREHHTDKAILEALDAIRQKNRPALHDETWYQLNLGKCTQDGRIDVERFRQLPDREQHTSLAGLALARRSTFTRYDPEARCVLDRSFLECVSPPTGKKALVERWLDVKDYAVTVVNFEDQPIGVIAVWKNSVNGITRFDLSALSTACRVLGWVHGAWEKENGKANSAHG